MKIFEMRRQDIGWIFINIIETLHRWFLKYFSDDPLYWR